MRDMFICTTCDVICKVLEACRRQLPALALTVIKKSVGVVNKTFAQMMEKPGYDIEITYVQRNSIYGAGTMEYLPWKKRKFSFI